jgi:hypothetical protein
MEEYTLHGLTVGAARHSRVRRREGDTRNRRSDLHSRAKLLAPMVAGVIFLLNKERTRLTNQTVRVCPDDLFPILDRELLAKGRKERQT